MYNTQRPRSFVTHLVNLAGADPIAARMFVESSGYAAIKRLGIKPATKARSRKTVTGRHVIVAVPDKKTGDMVQKNVRRRGTGRSRRRQGTGTITVHRWTLGQVALILGDMKPRKIDYKQIKADALDGLAVIEQATKPVRRLPRHRKWSKRR